MRFRVRCAGLLIALGACLPGHAAAQALSTRSAPPPAACPGGRISRLFIDNHSIFDPQELAGEHRFGWAYRLANALHVRTRPRFIRRELLFGPGSCYDPALLAESERLLREYPFIARADVFGLAQPDGSWHVVVDTQDEWTTKLNVGLRWDDTPEVARLDLTEENFLGRGILLGGFLRQRDDERDLGLRVEMPRLGGTRTDAQLSWGRTRTGEFFGQALQYPFVGEVGRLAGRELFVRREAAFPYALGADRDAPPGTPTHLLLPLDEVRVELTLAGRLGRPGNLTIFGAGVSHERIEFPDFPAGVERVLDERYGSPTVADSASIAAILPQVRHPGGTRANLLVGQRNVRFAQFRGLDALRGTQDVALGSDLALTLGRTVAGLEDATEDAGDDLYVRFRTFVGLAPRPFLILFTGGVEGRQRFSGPPGADGWDDVLAEATALLYWQPRDWPRHTFFARLSGVGGWHLTQPFQLTLGGETAVRGYDADAFPGGRRVVFSAEDRIYLGWPWPRLFDTGVTLFADVGNGWAGDAPFGMDAGWRGTLGTGLRFGFPAGSRGVVRADLAWPVEGEGLGSPFFRLSFGDPIGLVAGLVDRQLARTRRLAVGPDLFNVQRR